MGNWCPWMKTEFTFVEPKFIAKFLDSLLSQVSFGCSPNSMFTSGKISQKSTLVHQPCGIERPEDQAWNVIAWAWIGRFPLTETDSIDSDMPHL